VNVGRATRRVARTIVHNWPLKLGAIALAAILYVGLVASQDSNAISGPITVTPINQPSGTVITNQLRDVDQIRYLAPADLGRLRVEDFRATVDLANVKPDGNPATVRVNVTAVDPRVTILDVTPRTIQVVLDEKVSKQVKVVAALSDPPAGIQVGEVKVTPPSVTVTGASAAVSRVLSARVSVTIDSSGVSIDRDVRPDLVDAEGQVVSGVDMNPTLVNVQVPIYTNLQNRTVPVNPIVTGTPGAGFRIAAVEVRPLVLSVEGDQDQLAALVSADTAPVSVSGATRDVSSTVPFALPSGITAVGTQTATVTVRIVPVTETRTFTAGIRLDGRRPELTYEPSDLRVLLTVYGSTADLDRLAASPIVISLNVAALEPGVHDVAVVPSLPSAVTVAAISPETISVTVTARPTPAPAASTPGTSGAPPASAGPAPTPTISP
jgi:YbbR domain-containing protein